MSNTQNEFPVPMTFFPEHSSSDDHVDHVFPMFTLSLEPKETMSAKPKLTQEEIVRRQQIAAELTTLNRQALTRRKTFTDLVTKDCNLIFVYLRHRDPLTNEITPKGGMVVAYKEPLKGHKIVELSTAVCNDCDCFDREYGKYLAAKNFNEGRTVMVKLDQPSHYTHQLRDMFQFQD